MGVIIVLIKFIYMKSWFSLVQLDCEAMLEVRGEAEAEFNDFTTSPVLRSNPLPSFSYKKGKWVSVRLLARL